MSLSNLRPPELLGRDEVPDEGLDVLVPGVSLEAVHKAESNGVLGQSGLENIKRKRDWDL